MSNFEHLYLGNFSATPITHSVYLSCERCNVSWTGCWDNMECEYCGRDCLHGSDHPDNPLGLTSRQSAIAKSDEVIKQLLARFATHPKELNRLKSGEKINDNDLV